MKRDDQTVIRVTDPAILAALDARGLELMDMRAPGELMPLCRLRCALEGRHVPGREALLTLRCRTCGATWDARIRADGTLSRGWSRCPTCPRSRTGERRARNARGHGAAGDVVVSMEVKR